MKPTLRLLRLRGIPVDAHWTWPVAFAVVAWTLAASVFPSAYPEVGGLGHVVMAIVATGILFGSVVLHELAHAVVARREGMEVEGVCLWLLGGVSDVGGRPSSPGQEFRIAASGPAVSLILAAVLAAAGAWGEGRGWPDPVHGVLEYAARLNVVVAAFNLIPALPLDGGRILRSWLWHRQHDLLAATRSGARAGQAFGLTLVVVGVLDVLSGAILLGVWLAVLGGFLLRAASSELAEARTRHRLDGLTAADVMASDPGVVLNDTPVSRLVQHPPAPVRTGYPVLGGGRLLGVIVLDNARRVPSDEADQRPVEDVMTPLDDVPMVDADAAVVDVVDRLNGTNATGQVVVVADGMVVGILDEADVAGALDRAPGTAGARAVGVRAWAVVAGLCVLAGAALYRPPYAIVSAGPQVDVTADVSLAGITVTPVNGRYVVPTVTYRRSNAIATVLAAVRGGERVVPASRADDQADAGAGAGGPGLSREARILAAAAAALSQNLPATVTGTGARVAAVRPGSAAAGVLRPGDVILAVDSRPVSQSALLAEVVRAGAPGTLLSLSVERGGRVEVIPVTIAAGGLGLTVETRDLAVELPFEVRFEGRAAGGPGAGLAYALAIADLLSSTDVAQGRTIAAAGAVDADGHVVPVDGLADPAALAEAAADAGAAVLVVPPELADGARRDGLAVQGVESLARALEALSTTV
ncbi:MAG: hypothetical protein QOH36_292 [Actinomycetota bacterium]|nr:hypothetical protein [Actinomycetota bacterium]